MILELSKLWWLVCAMSAVVSVLYLFFRSRCRHNWKKAEVWCYLKELGGRGDAADKVLLVLRKCAHCKREEAWVESMTKRVKVKPAYARQVIRESYSGAFFEEWGREEW